MNTYNPTFNNSSKKPEAGKNRPLTKAQLFLAATALSIVGVSVNEGVGNPVGNVVQSVANNFDAPEGVDLTKPHKQIMVTEEGETLWHISKLAEPEARDLSEVYNMLRQDLPDHSSDLQAGEIVPLPMDSAIGEVVPGEQAK